MVTALPHDWSGVTELTAVRGGRARTVGALRLSPATVTAIPAQLNQNGVTALRQPGDTARARDLSSLSCLSQYPT